MIVTPLDSPMMEQYAKMHPRFPKALAALRELAESDPADGRYEIEGDALFLLVQSYDSKVPETPKFETHRNYIDIQYILEGCEEIGDIAPQYLTPMAPYKPDTELFSTEVDFGRVLLRKNDLAIFFPGEPHAPGLAHNASPAPTRKIIAKVLA